MEISSIILSSNSKIEEREEIGEVTKPNKKNIIKNVEFKPLLGAGKRHLSGL
jgi:hypothetical protein